MSDNNPSLALIFLTQGKVAIVDPWRYAALMKFHWRAVQHKRSWYAKTTIYKDGKQIDISMHRFIAHTPFGMVCHHRNRNSLDNQERNLENQTKQYHDAYERNNKILIKYETTPTIKLTRNTNPHHNGRYSNMAISSDGRTKS